MKCNVIKLHQIRNRKNCFGSEMKLKNRSFNGNVVCIVNNCSVLTLATLTFHHHTIEDRKKKKNQLNPI